MPCTPNSEKSHLRVDELARRHTQSARKHTESVMNSWQQQPYLIDNADKHQVFAVTVSSAERMLGAGIQDMIVGLPHAYHCSLHSLLRCSFLHPHSSRPTLTPRLLIMVSISIIRVLWGTTRALARHSVRGFPSALLGFGWSF